MRSSLLLALLAAAGCGSGSPPRAAIVVATTTSVAHSGIADALSTAYERHSGIAVRVSAVGSGRALAMLAGRQADVAITHAPAQETEALSKHPGWFYRKFLYNDFVIVGPRDDPAGVAAATTAIAAMHAIAAGGIRFVSRGDGSGTEERELQLWEAAVIPPERRPRVVAGAGMGATLRIAAETSSYTLTDRGTFMTLAQQSGLRVLHEGDPSLVNTYAVIAAEADRGGQFARWVASDAGRAALTAVMTSGTVKGFHLWPAGADAAAPAALPPAGSAR